MQFDLSSQHFFFSAGSSNTPHFPLAPLTRTGITCLGQLSGKYITRGIRFKLRGQPKNNSMQLFFLHKRYVNLMIKREAGIERKSIGVIIRGIP
jgi:hypothetical protein